LLTTAELAARADFTLGLAIVSPSSRTIAGPGGTADIEPRVMQVLVVLAAAAGAVVTRDTLFNRCWGGVFVGDDSLNRVIAAVRKLATEIADGSFEIETIPRTGYRQAGARPVEIRSDADDAIRARKFTRREIAEGAAGFLALGGIGTWAAVNSREQQRFDALMREAFRTTRDNSELDPDKARRALEQAVRMRPDSARAWGLLAAVRALEAQEAPPDKAVAAVAAALQTAQQALRLDPKEPNALLAMFWLEGSTLDWWTRDRRLRQIIGIDPTNVPAMGELLSLLQAAGYSRESWNWNARAIALEPLSEDLLSKRALKLWIFGRIADSDKVIDQLRALFPTSPWPWWVRFVLYALTDRPRAAHAMLNADPSNLQKAELAIWRPGIEALITRSPSSMATTREACMAGARTSGDIAGQAVLIMCTLREVDAAFDVANGFLLSRGSIVRAGKSQTSANDADSRISTQWLFTPPCSVMYSDPRFLGLCEGIGLTDYWHRRGAKPDFMRRA
jgi:DNA-binding winged helix-turn-helix (wHTH) protein